MKINKFFIFCFFLLNFLSVTDLIGQIQLGLYSYSEYFYSPKESHNRTKLFNNGYNKDNFSSQLGGFLSYKVNDLFTIEVGLQKNVRKFDCNCVNVRTFRDDVYFISDSSCIFQLKAKYHILQIPLSVKYRFPTQSKSLFQSIGVANTLVYNLSRENLILGNTASIKEYYHTYFLSALSPELFYDLGILVQEKWYANIAIGLRMEAARQQNYAFFVKVGMSYSFEKEKPKRRQRR